MRPAIARVLAGLSAVFWAMPFFGLVDLTTVFLNRGPEWWDGYLLEASWGLLFTVLVAVPLTVLAFRPGDPAAGGVLVVTVAALLAGAAWATALAQFLTAVGLAVDVALVLALGGVRRPRTRRPDRLLLGVSVVVAVGAAAYGRDVLAHPSLLDSVTNGVDHHGVHAALGLALAGCVGLAAVVPDRLPAWCAAGCLLWLGVMALVYPDLEGSLGPGGGLTAVVAGAVTVTASAARPRLKPRRAAAR